MPRFPFLRSLRRAVRQRGALRIAALGVRVLATEGAGGIRRRLAAHAGAPLAVSDPKGDPRAFAIVTTPHVAHIAAMIADLLREHGFSPQITDDTAGLAGFAHVLVLTPQSFDDLPDHFVAFQLEQSVTDRWLTPACLAQLGRARAVLDYSVDNIAHLHARGLPLHRLFLVPLDTDPARSRRPHPTRREGALFYGDASSPRRRAILAELSRAIPELRIETALFGPPLQAALHRAAVVVNVHFYDGALLETARLTQALSHGAQVVSEAGSDAGRHPGLAEVVDFAPVGDVDTLIRLVRRALDDPARARDRTAAIRAYATRPDNAFRRGFLRYLLAEGLISPAAFAAGTAGGTVCRATGGAEKSGTAVPHVCLTLPETPARTAAFAAQPAAARFGLWPGLRARSAWRGAALSHAAICRELLSRGADEAVICEDDVLFPPDFAPRLAAIRAQLDPDPDWEMFSGYIADAGPGWRVGPRSVLPGGMGTLIDSDRAVSMVFNILRRPVMEHLAAWNDRDDDPFANTIDRWLERRPTRVVIALPYLVGHRAGDSTLRDVSVTHYDHLARRSAARLAARAGLAGAP